MNLKENNLKVNVIEQRKQKNSTSDWKRRKVKKKNRTLYERIEINKTRYKMSNERKESLK